MGELKLYITSQYKTIIISSLICLIWWYSDGWVVFTGLFILNFIFGYVQYQKDVDFHSSLKAKGLTLEDAANIKFVKEWDTVRQRGINKYCVIDGGIICGAGLSLLTSVLSLITLKTPFTEFFADPSDMFKFIGYNYIAGIVVGVILFRVRWPYNEKRFLRLTDPLNFQFSSVRDLL